MIASTSCDLSEKNLIRENRLNNLNNFVLTENYCCHYVYNDFLSISWTLTNQGKSTFYSKELLRILKLAMSLKFHQNVNCKFNI